MCLFAIWGGWRDLENMDGFWFGGKEREREGRGGRFEELDVSISFFFFSFLELVFLNFARLALGYHMVLLFLSSLSMHLYSILRFCTIY